MNRCISAYLTTTNLLIILPNGETCLLRETGSDFSVEQGNLIVKAYGLKLTNRLKSTRYVQDYQIESNTVLKYYCYWQKSFYN